MKKTVVGGKIHIKMWHLVEPYDQIRSGLLDSFGHPISIAPVHGQPAKGLDRHQRDIEAVRHRTLPPERIYL